jgi:catechol 2,3-dioxygenase-like lactoylglutathione lyase family enzyme
MPVAFQMWSDPFATFPLRTAMNRLSLTAMIRLLVILLAVVAGSPLSAAETNRQFHLPSLYHVGYWVRDIAKSRAFYKDYLGYDEPYVLNRTNGVLQMVVMKVNERQVILLFPDATRILPNGDNLDHLGLETDNIAAAREHLLAHGVNVGAVGRGRIGDLLLGIKDPDGHAFELTQFMPEGQLLQHQGTNLASGLVSSHLRSATIAVTNLAASLHFYVDILGFKKIEGDAGQPGGAVRLQVTDGTDYLDLMPYERKPDAVAARAVPDFSLEVADAAKTAELLTARAKTLGFDPPAPVSVAADGRRQTSCVDPDGTRVVLKEESRRTAP